MFIFYSFSFRIKDYTKDNVAVKISQAYFYEEVLFFLNNSEILVSLDIGTNTIKVIIGEVQHDSLNIIGVGTAASNGMKKVLLLISTRLFILSEVQSSRLKEWLVWKLTVL